MPPSGPPLTSLPHEGLGQAGSGQAGVVQEGASLTHHWQQPMCSGERGWGVAGGIPIGRFSCTRMQLDNNFSQVCMFVCLSVSLCISV